MTSITSSVEPPWMHRPAPEPLGLIQRFVNTHAHSGLPEQLNDSRSVRAWLQSEGREQDLLSVAEVERLRSVREVLRDVLLSHAGHADAVEARAALVQAVAAPQLSMTWDDLGRVQLTGTGASAQLLINDLMAGLAMASISGNWGRLKACGNEECRAAFWDHTRNSSARFCSSAGCANRMRQRAFRKRSRTLA